MRIHPVVVAWTFGVALGALKKFLVRNDRIRIVGEENLVKAAKEGRAMVLCSHPTLLYETFGLGMILYPHYLFDLRCFVWSVPDKRLLDKWEMPDWVRESLRCVQVNRTDKKVGAARSRNMIAVLQEGGVVVAHPEEGRTFGDANRHKTPIIRGPRRMQKIESSLTQLAHIAEATIVPCYVEVNDYSPVGIDVSFKRLFGAHNRKHWPVVYHFGTPYKTSNPFDLERENARLQEAIFNA